MLDPDLHDELKALAAAIPGASVSGLINGGIRPAVPYFARVRQALADNNAERVKSIMGEMIGSALLDVHTAEKEKGGKEKVT
jgi:hypothetical protein